MLSKHGKTWYDDFDDASLIGNSRVIKLLSGKNEKNGENCCGFNTSH